MTPIESEILEMCINTLTAEVNWDEILKQEFYFHWIVYIEKQNPDLKGDPFEGYLRNRDDLSKLIRKHREIVVHKIASQINSSIIRPDSTLTPNQSYKLKYDPWSKLLDELTKLRHILPVRKLVDQYESLIFKIAPCWLATPEAVSSILSLKW